jgi:protein SCO1/2
MKKIIYGLIIAISISACNSQQKENRTLPIYGNREPVTKTVNGKTVTDTLYQTIPDFKFVNQYGDSINRKSLDGSIYVADFFFTSCPNICPVMHRNMLEVYNTFKNTGDFKIISQSIDPKHDSVKVLKEYADKLGIEGNTWWFLQGDKDETYKLGKSYMVTVKDGGVHDGYFLLIDKAKRIRGSYLGTDPAEVKKLIADIKILQAEPEQTIAQ